MAADFALFWDECSLWQEEAAAEPSLSTQQMLQREEGRRLSALWYGHRHTCCFIAPEVPLDDSLVDQWPKDEFDMDRCTHLRSGWITLQCTLASFLKPSHKLLDISRHPPHRPDLGLEAANAYHAWFGEKLVPLCAVPRGPPPPLPERFAHILRYERHWAASADAELAVAIYNDYFFTAARGVTQLDCSGRGWSGADMRALAALLANCPRCTSLDVSNNPLGPSGGRALVHMLSQSGCPITHVDVRRTTIAAESVRALLQLRRLKSVAVAPLSLYSSHTAIALETAEGQFAYQPRLMLEACAGEDRAIEAIARGELEVSKAEWATRRAHRLGWGSNRLV